MIRLALALALGGCREPVRHPPPGSGSPTDSTPSSTTDTGIEVDPGVPVTVSASPEVACEEPSLRLASHFDRVLAPPEPAKDSWFWGGGVIVGDFTGDGLHDIVLPGYWGTVFYVGLPGGTWAVDPRLDALPLDFASGGSAADYDGDGDLDLLITRFLMPDKLLRNQAGQFTDVSAEAGIANVLRRSMTSTWGDYDGDGDLDLYVGAYGFIDESGIDHADFEPADPDFLYRNNGDGTFADRSADLPQEVHDGYAFAATWIDLDRDGLPELYTVNDFGAAFPNTLLWNHGAAGFVLDDGSKGLALEITGMGLGLGDLNGDGQADFVMPEWNGIVVVESSPLDTWVQTGFARGIYNDISRNQKVGWGAELVDLDNDGDLDLPIAFGYLETLLYDAPQDERDALFEQTSDGSFSDRGAAWGWDDPTDGRGFVVADLDDNGWLDVVKRDLQGPTILSKARCGSAHWVKLKLRQPGANRFAVGARVRVFADDLRLTRWNVAGGTSHASGGPPELHFGVGEAPSLRRIEVTWPDGSVSNVFDQPVDRTLTIQR